MFYPINEDVARRAKEMNSFGDYKPGSATASYQARVAEAQALADKCKAETDPMYHDKIDYLLDKYCRLLARNINQANEIDARCPSILVSGGGNFPVRKKEKQNAARERNLEDYRRVEAILDQMRSVGRGGISSDDPQAIEKLKAKLEALERDQEMMKAANAAIRLKDRAKGDAKLAELGLSPEHIAELREPDFAGRIGYPSYLLSNNNANIRRIRERIQQLEKQRQDDTLHGWEFDGGEVVVNKEANRLQILFDDKPGEEMRAELKAGGFRWAPSQGAWQRQLTDNAIRSAKRIKGIAP